MATNKIKVKRLVKILSINYFFYEIYYGGIYVCIYLSILSRPDRPSYCFRLFNRLPCRGDRWINTN
jgi:hypothetical protein